METNLPAPTKVRSRPTSPSNDVSSHQLLTIGKLEDLQIAGSSSSSSSSQMKAEGKLHLPPLPQTGCKSHDVPLDVPNNNRRKSRRSFGDEAELSPLSTNNNFSSPGEKSSPSDTKSSPGSSKGVPSPEQRRQSFTQQLPHLENDFMSARSKTPEPIDALSTLPSQRHKPALEHFESKEISPNSSRRSRTPEPLLSAPTQRHAPALAHLENDSLHSAPSSSRRSRTPEPQNGALLAPTRHHQPTLEHLDRGPLNGMNNDRDSIVRRLENFGEDTNASDRYHLHDHLSDARAKRLSESK